MEIRKDDDTKVEIFLEGEIDFYNSDEIYKKLLNSYNKNYKKIEINFSKVKNIDASGIGKLIAFNNKLKDEGIKLIIKDIENKTVNKAFEFVGFNKIIYIKE